MIRLKLLLIAIIALLSVSVYASQLPMATLAQEFYNSNSTEAVTSTNDAILKSILIVSQVSVIGITFSYFFFHIVPYLCWASLGNKNCNLHVNNWVGHYPLCPKKESHKEKNQRRRSCQKPFKQNT